MTIILVVMGFYGVYMIGSGVLLILWSVYEILHQLYEYITKTGMYKEY